MVHTRSQTQASRDATRAFVQTMRDTRRSRMMTDVSQARSQAMKDAAQLKVDQYIASCKPITNQMQRMTPLSTPVKQTQHIIITPTAPVKQSRYNTRSSIKSNLNMDLSTETNESSMTIFPTTLVFDAAFFDEASRAWNQNKIKLGNGMYSYNTRSVSKKN